MSSLKEAVRKALNVRVFIPCAAVFLLAGLSLSFVLRFFFFNDERMPMAVIAASFVLQFGGLAVLLAWLPRAAETEKRIVPMGHVAAWLAACALCGLGLGALALVEIQRVSPRLFIVLWLLFAAHGAAVTVLDSMLGMLLFPAANVARQLTVLIVVCLVTALFWSREPIQALSGNASGHEGISGVMLTQGVMSLSLPVACATVWHQESSHPEAQRFDLLRGRLTYSVWIGSYRAVPYPALWPRASAPGDPGLVLALLAWALPLLTVTEWLRWRQVMKFSSGEIGIRATPVV